MAAQSVSGIYEIVNLVNGKRYIGSAKNFEQRWYIHRRALASNTHHSRYLQRAWNKYGPDSFEFRRIETCQMEALIEREQAAIDSMSPEYNVAKIAGSTLGVRFTAEGRRNISAALKGKLKGLRHSPERVEKRAATHRGKKRSEETRRKIAERARGRPFVRFNDEYKAKLSSALKGRKLPPEHMAALQAGRARRIYTDEQRAAISEDLKRAYAEGRRSRERPPEYREKIASSLRGRKATAESRANQSAAQRGKKRGPYKLDPAKAEARREAGRRLAAIRNERRASGVTAD